MSSVIFGQTEGGVSADTIRKQWYLIVKNYSSDGYDIPREYLFIPSDKVQNDLRTSYINSTLDRNYNELYLLNPYLRDINTLMELNTAISKATSLNYSFMDKSVNFYQILNKIKVSFTYEEEVYGVVFLDGLWVKIKIGKRFISYFGTPYNLKTLNRDCKDYDLYFLIDLKIHSYDLILSNNID